MHHIKDKEFKFSATALSIALAFGLLPLTAHSIGPNKTKLQITTDSAITINNQQEPSDHAFYVLGFNEHNSKPTLFTNRGEDQPITLVAVNEKRDEQVVKINIQKNGKDIEKTISLENAIVLNTANLLQTKEDGVSHLLMVDLKNDSSVNSDATFNSKLTIYGEGFKSKNIEKPSDPLNIAGINSFPMNAQADEKKDNKHFY